MTEGHGAGSRSASPAEDAGQGSLRAAPRPADIPGDRPTAQARLARAPSERYRKPEANAPSRDSSGTGSAERWRGSPFAAAWGGLAAGLAGAVIFTVLAGGLAFDWGLVLVAGYVGWTVAQGVKLGGQATISPRTRRLLTLGLALLALSGGEVGTWLWARSQGGNLAFLDHLWTVYGPLVVVQYALASATALWSSR